MKTILILSGGLDSTTLLYWLLRKGHEVRAISFDYGQKHKRELVHASCIANDVRVPHEIIELGPIFSKSALMSDVPMPHEDYSVESMKATVVPNRNMVMLSIAISRAIQVGYDSVAIGAHAGDRDVYPDCRPHFISAMNDAAWICHYYPVEVLAPFLFMSKKQIAQEAQRLKVPIEKTWSCYEGGDEPCGTCGSCRARQEALA